MAINKVRRGARSRAVLVVATISVLVSGCSAVAADPAAACDTAVAQAMAVEPNSDSVDAVDGAMASCPSLEAWVTAAKRYPDTTAGQDPVTYAITRCKTSSRLVGAEVCRVSRPAN